MNLARNIILAFALMVSMQAVRAQGGNEKLATFMSEVRKSGEPSANFGSLLVPESVNEIFHVLPLYILDSLYAVYQTAFFMATDIAGRSVYDTQIRKATCGMLVLMAGILPQVKADIIYNEMCNLPEGLFDRWMADTMEARVAKQASNSVNCLLFAAHVYAPNLNSLLNNLLDKPEYAQNKMDLRLALARLGDEQQINYFVDKLSSGPVNQQLVSSVYPRMVYTRQKKIIDILVKELMNDEPNCSGYNPDSDEAIPCGYRIMPMIAPVIEDFPLKTDGYGDIDTNNYEDALRIAREWFSKNNMEYNIKRLK